MLKNASNLFLLCILLILVGCGTAKSTHIPLTSAQEGYVDAGGGVRLFYRLLGAGPDTLVGDSWRNGSVAIKWS